jgi:plasmid stabilization system protein ParE
LADLAEAGAFLRAHDPAAADRVMGRPAAVIDRIALFPESGRRGRVAGTRELVVAATPFIIAYRLTAATVDILAVIHAARRWPSGFE